jgi:hypothetical protein
VLLGYLVSLVMTVCSLSTELCVGFEAQWQNTTSTTGGCCCGHQRTCGTNMMAHNHTVGVTFIISLTTIFRVSGLAKEADTLASTASKSKPLWFLVVAAFDRKCFLVLLINPEHARAHLYTAKGMNNYGILQNIHESIIQRVNKCSKLGEGLSEHLL